jgi:hypothetical protein
MGWHPRDAEARPIGEGVRKGLIWGTMIGEKQVAGGWVQARKGLIWESMIERKQVAFRQSRRLLVCLVAMEGSFYLI